MTTLMFAGLMNSGCQSTDLTATADLPVVVLTDGEQHQPASQATVKSDGAPPLGMPSKSGSAHSELLETNDADKQLSSAWHEQIASQFEHAKRLVEAQLDTDLASVRLMLVDDSPINQEVALETSRLVHSQFDRKDFADQFLKQVMQSQAGTYAALFSARLNAVMVSSSMLRNFENSLPRDRQIRQSALLTLLIHELVHAADDKRYNIHANRALSFRASFAQSATFEGHAQWVTRTICEQSGCASGLLALDNFMFSKYHSGNQLAQPVEAISRNVLEYSYIEGERFISKIANRSGGARLIDTILSSPPHDPVQILAPETYPDIDRDERNDRLIRASQQIDHPWVSSPWVSVETSPLKGINLRAEPARRQAAIDGFTRLIQGMVAMQLYDQHDVDIPPVEVTLLQAESAHTARLFATTLHNNTHQSDAQVSDEPLKIRLGAGIRKSHMNLHLYRTQIDEQADIAYRTAIGVSGPYVVQITGTARNAQILEDYAIRVLVNLQLSAL